MAFDCFIQLKWQLVNNDITLIMMKIINTTYQSEYNGYDRQLNTLSQLHLLCEICY